MIFEHICSKKTEYIVYTDDAQRIGRIDSSGYFKICSKKKHKPTELLSVNDLYEIIGKMKVVLAKKSLAN